MNSKSFCYKDIANYKYGVFLPNSGHLQVSVDPESVRVEYIRSFLPDEGRNGEVAYQYTIE